MTFTKKPGSRIIMPYFLKNIQDKMHDMQIVNLIIIM